MVLNQLHDNRPTDFFFIKTQGPHTSALIFINYTTLKTPRGDNPIQKFGLKTKIDLFLKQKLICLF